MADPRNLQKSTEQTKILDKFLVDNAELEELTAKLGVFNIFGVLRIEQAEIRHSNVLAWLLDPQGGHGLGDALLRRFLSTILLEDETANIELSSARVELMTMRDVEVWREWKNIDLLAFSRANRWVLFLENKIRAKAYKRQLQKYAEAVQKEFAEYTVIPVLLTLEEDDGLDVAEDVDFISWSHAQLYHILNHLIDQRKDRIPQDAKVFLDHYLLSLRRLTMQDEELVSLCKAIYRKHKEAIDLIVEWGATSQFGIVAENFISDNQELVQLGLRPRQLWLIPLAWKRSMPPCSDRWKFLSEPYPVACWFNFRPNRSSIGLVIEVGSMEDSGKRRRLIKRFEKEGFKIGSKAFREEARYTRVHSIYRRMFDADDTDEIRKHMDELWKRSEKYVDVTTKIVESFKW